MGLTTTLSTLSCALFGLIGQADGDVREALLLENIALASPEQGAVENGCSVLVEGGVITAVGRRGRVAAPAGGRVLDGRGRWLVPGFYEMHVHLPGEDSSIPREATDEVLGMMLENGITSVRVARGAPDQLALRARLEEAGAKAPRLLLSAPPLRRTGFPELEVLPSLFADWRGAGYDHVKFLSGPAALFEDEGAGYLAVAEAAREAGLGFYGHAPLRKTGRDLEVCRRARQASVEHVSALETLFDLSEDEARRELEALASAGVALCLDVEWYQVLSDRETIDSLRARKGLGRLPGELIETWTENRRLPDPRRAGYSRTVDRITKLGPLLRDVGVPLVLSASSAPFIVPGPSYVREARHAAALGYTPREVLAMATLNGARCCGEDATRGRIAPGLVADLVLLEADPFESVEALGQIAAVVRGGELVWRAEPR